MFKMNFTSCMSLERCQRAADQLQGKLSSLMVLCHFLVPRCTKNQEYKSEITQPTTHRNGKKEKKLMLQILLTRTKNVFLTYSKTQLMSQKRGTALDLKKYSKISKDRSQRWSQFIIHEIHESTKGSLFLKIMTYEFSSPKLSTC